MSASWRKAGLGFLIILAVLGADWVWADWQEPLAAPPVCPAGSAGCDLPLHTGNASQIKAGSLGINVPDMVGFKLDVGGSGLFSGGLATLGDVISGGQAAVGPGFVAVPPTITPDPVAILDLDGQIKIRGGNAGLGRVLVSDDFGLASWQVPVKEIGSSVMYLRSRAGPFDPLPAACPAGWSEADLKTEYVADGQANNIRTCILTNLGCQVMHLRSTTVSAPASCPVGWNESDFKTERVSATYNNYVRTCSRCTPQQQQQE